MNSFPLLYWLFGALGTLRDDLQSVPGSSPMNPTMKLPGLPQRV